MTYQQCLDYLFSQLPIYQRIGQAAYKADLNNTIELLKRLANPELNFKSIHIAGTNGKGSVSHMLASVFQEAGYKTGLYTSPHMKDFKERIKINGKEITEKKVIEFVERHLSMVEDIKPSFFEWTVALAFQHFWEEKVDIAIVEVGMGGRLDSTNVLMPELSVITSIGLDHMRFLGDNLKAIAGEKAGIIKQNIPVVIGEYLVETKEVFDEKAKKLQAPIVYAQDKMLLPFDSDLKGPYQKTNQQTVLHSLEIVKNRGYKIEEKHIKNGLLNVVSNTGLHGRWEWIGKKPDILVDSAHNKDGISIVMNEISKLNYPHVHFVCGMVSDKDVSAVLRQLPKEAQYYFCKPDIPRGLEAAELRSMAFGHGLTGQSYDSVMAALYAAKSVADQNDLIFVGGSTFVVAEVLP